MTESGAMPSEGPSGMPFALPATWLGALAVLGIALLLGLAAIPRQPRRWAWFDAILLRLIVGLALLPPLALWLGQFPELLFKLPWLIIGIIGWVFALSHCLIFSIKKFNEVNGLAAPVQVSGNLNSSLNRWQHLASLIGWIAVFFLLLFLLIPGFCPPLNYDVLEYHLGMIPHIFAQRRIEPIPGVFYTAQPIATEMLYTLAAIIEKNAWGRAPGVLHWLMIILGAVIYARIAALLEIPALWRPWFLLLLLAHPIIFSLNIDQLTDWTGLLMLAGGIWVYLEDKRAFGGHDSMPPLIHMKTAVLMGIFAAGAINAKWTNAGTVVLPLLILATRLGKQEKLNANIDTHHQKLIPLGLAGFSIFCATVILLWLPWGIWLWITRRNPFAPFGAGLFPGLAWPPERLNFLMETHGPLFPWRTGYWANLAARLAWDLPGPPLIAMSLSATAAFAVFHRVGRRIVPEDKSDATFLFSLSLGVLFSVLLWGRLKYSADRFLAPVLFAAALILPLNLKWMIDWLSQNISTRARWMLASALLPALPGLWMLNRQLTLFRESGFTSFMLGYDLGRSNQAGFWESEQMPIVTPGFSNALAQLPKDAKVIAINEARRYFFPGGVSLASVFDESPVRPAVAGAKDAETIRRRLRQAGYTHLLFNEYEMVRILGMHTPLRLIDNREFQTLLREGDRQELVNRYWGYTEFSVDPPLAGERKAYGDFLKLMREKAIYLQGAFPDNKPAIWIAPLE